MPSIADWIGSALYLLSGAAALATSRLVGKGHRDRLHWVATGLFFFGLAAYRLLQCEESIRDALRAALTSGPAYDQRHFLQAIAVSLILLGGAATVTLAVAMSRSRARAVLVTRLAVIGLVGLSLVRIASLHAIDQLLYAPIGPLRLHYFIEFALLSAIVASAWQAVRASGPGS